MKNLSWILVVSLTITACGQAYTPAQSATAPVNTSVSPERDAMIAPAPPAETVSPGEKTPPASVETTPAILAESGVEKISICSKLDFNGINWSSAVETGLRTAMALALNISGSFEGPDGWQNLTNNFDGQGMSYGLLNQCLGQGSLQPLLIRMRDNFRDQLTAKMAPAHLNSMMGMLSQWEQHTSVASIDLREYGLSPLDEPTDIAEITGTDFMVQLTSYNQASVNWAVANLYKGSAFKADWKAEFLALANTPGYRSLQVEAATQIHLSALKYVRRFALRELRSYLFFFDIVVQNGGLPAGDITYLENLFAKKPSLTETAKLNAILDRRITHVKKVYQADVRSRKSSIINGAGTVHGSKRNYGKEFCADLRVQLR